MPIMNHRYVNIVWAADISLPRLEHALSIIYTNKGKGKPFLYKAIEETAVFILVFYVTTLSFANTVCHQR
jgi:hypothetical protein